VAVLLVCLTVRDSLAAVTITDPEGDKKEVTLKDTRNVMIICEGTDNNNVTFYVRGESINQLRAKDNRYKEEAKLHAGGRYRTTLTIQRTNITVDKGTIDCRSVQNPQLHRQIELVAAHVTVNNGTDPSTISVKAGQNFTLSCWVKTTLANAVLDWHFNDHAVHPSNDTNVLKYTVGDVKKADIIFHPFNKHSEGKYQCLDLEGNFDKCPVYTLGGVLHTLSGLLLTLTMSTIALVHYVQ